MEAARAKGRDCASLLSHGVDLRDISQATGHAFRLRMVYNPASHLLKLTSGSKGWAPDPAPWCGSRRSVYSPLREEVDEEAARLGVNKSGSRF